MANVTVVGAQWGDEGKGKIVDWLCNRADVVVRFQGGHNAGHTLVVDGKTYKLAANSGKNAIHGGNKGFAQVVWTIGTVSEKAGSSSVSQPRP